MNYFLGHEKVIIRFVSLYLLGLILFFISWIVSYFLLPEGILRGASIMGRLAGETSATSAVREFLQIFILNLVGFGIIIIGNLVLQVKSFSFGYLVPLAWMILYAITLGTNSFSIPMEKVMSPSLTVFTRSGLYEMMAGVLLATATNSISLNKSGNIFASSEPVPKEERLPLKKEQWIAIVIAILILAGAALREAYMIFMFAIIYVT